MEFVLPLLNKIAGADNETAHQAATNQKLLHEQAGHDRLAQARVVLKKKTERCRRKFKRRILREFKMRQFEESNSPRFQASYFAAEVVAVLRPRIGVADDGSG